MPDASASTGDDANSQNTITIGNELKAGDVIKVVLKTGDAPEETVTAIVGGISFAYSSHTVEYYNGTPTSPEYKIKADYYGSSSSPAITYTQDITTYATIESTTGVISTVKAGGPTVITANLSATANPLDLAGTATFELNVVKQNSKIVGFGDKTFTSTSNSITTTDILADWTSSIKAEGAKDGEDTTGAIDLTITDVKKNGTSMSNWDTYFEVSGKKIQPKTTIPNSGSEDDEYVITVKASGVEVTDMYNAPKEETAKVTVTVTHL